MSTRINPYPNRQGQTAGPSDGSRTITIHDVPTGEQGGSDKGSGRDEEGENSQIGVLRLRGGGNTRRVVWSSETIDNEGMGKKKSKICCIYHKPKAFDESSGESSDSTSSDSDSSISEASASSHASAGSGVNASKSLQAKKKDWRNDGNENHSHTNAHGQGKGRSSTRAGGSSTVVETQKETPIEESSSKPIPNAYEKGNM